MPIFPAPIPIFDIDNFRLEFAEFCNSEIYSKPLIGCWAAVGEQVISYSRYQKLYLPALQLYVAHKLVLAAKNLKIAKNGKGIPGQDVGAITSKHIEGISKSMDVTIAADKDGGEFNLTSYGLQFLELRKIATIGGMFTGQTFNRVYW